MWKSVDVTLPEVLQAVAVETQGRFSLPVRALCCAALTALLADAQDHRRMKWKSFISSYDFFAQPRLFLTTVCMMLVWPVCQTGPSSSHHFLARLINSTSDRFASGLRKGEQKLKEGVMLWSWIRTAHVEYIGNDAPRKNTVGAPGNARCNVR